MRFYRAVFRRLVVIVLAGFPFDLPGAEFPSSCQPDGQLALRLSADPAPSIPEVVLELRVVNRGRTDIAVDLQPLDRIDILDKAGRYVPQVPASIRGKVGESVITVYKGTSTLWSVSLRNLTEDALNNPPYSIRWCYDTTGWQVLEGANVYLGKVVSNVLRIDSVDGKVIVSEDEKAGK